LPPVFDGVECFHLVSTLRMPLKLRHLEGIRVVFSTPFFGLQAYAKVNF